MSEKDIISTKIITSETIKRLAKDVKHLKKNPLTSNGIFYHHDEENILKGYAMIIGPSDTIYENGFYLFEFNYPTDYPASPPTVMFRTNQNRIRFNPNLYVSGKVCISILNTWRGDQWSSCQSISSILLTLCTLFINEPILNEPGVTSRHKDFTSYHAIVEYSNIDIAILNIIDKSSELYIPWFDLFYDDALKHFKQSIFKINDKIKSFMKRYKHNSVFTSSIYSMRVFIDYEKLIPKFNRIVEQYASPEDLEKWKPIVFNLPRPISTYEEMDDLLTQLIGTSTNEILPTSPPYTDTPTKTPIKISTKSKAHKNK